MSVFEDLKARVGEELGTGDWLTIDQDRIDAFADATGDHQWIHVDAERAAQGPFGATIAHGFLTLSLLPTLSGPNAIPRDGVKMGINYGLNKVRFITPVKVGSRIRARRRLVDVTQGDGWVQFATEVTVEIEGAEKPACVAETLTRLYV